MYRMSPYGPKFFQHSAKQGRKPIETQIIYTIENNVENRRRNDKSATLSVYLGVNKLKKFGVLSYCTSLENTDC